MNYTQEKKNITAITYVLATHCLTGSSAFWVCMS